MRIIPAILEKDFQEAQKQVALVDGLAELIQIDIMDGRYVENESVKLKELINLQHQAGLEIHLMVDNPRDYFSDCAELKAERVFWHYDAPGATEAETILTAGRFNFKKGLAINPDVDWRELDKVFMKNFEAVLIMGVYPGRQGQKFIRKTIDIVKYFRQLSDKLIIAVDGGVDTDNIGALIEAGAEDFCIGSALLKSPDPNRKFAELKSFLK